MLSFLKLIDFFYINNIIYVLKEFIRMDFFSRIKEITLIMLSD